MKLYAAAVRIFYTLTRPLSGVLLHNSRRVRVLVVSGDNVLLQRSSFGRQKWSLPGGGIGKNENPFHAAIRELKEEVGVVVEEDSLECIGEARLPVHKRWPMLDLIFYKVELPRRQTPVITRRHEILEAGWFKLSNLPKEQSKTLDVALKMSKYRLARDH